MTKSEAVPSVADRFAHILAAIDTVQKETRGVSEDALADDRMLPLALERLLEIICVATDHIPSDLKETEVAVDWQNLADIGRRLENACDRIESEVLWDVTQNKLTPLRAFAQRYVEA